MKVSRKCLAWTFTGFAWAVIAGVPALAEDVELFVGTTGAGSGTQPNILFILDTSGSMGNQVATQPQFNPATPWGGACNPNRIYWRAGTGNPPDCTTTNQWFDDTYLACEAAIDAFAVGTGRYTDTIAQYDSNVSYTGDEIDRWEDLSSGASSSSIRSDEFVECAADHGVHGNGSATEVYAQSGDPANLWTSNSLLAANWSATPTNTTYTIYQGNYINWTNSPTIMREKIAILRDVATNLVNSVNGVNIGLMQFNRDRGGPVIHAVEDVATARTSLVSTIAGLTDYLYTPLSETLYEAGLYYRGVEVDYGDQQGPPNSIAESRQDTNPANSGYDFYESPIEFGCQKNFVVLITDGMPTQDSGADSRITGQPGFTAATGSGSCSGNCLDEQASYLYNADLIGNGIMPDQQNVITYTVGFDVNFQLLQDTADAGGGEYLIANDTASLSIQLTNIVTSILDEQTTFTAPTVSVNSFNRTRNLNDIFVAVFQPSGNFHWSGNLKKYGIDPASAEIIDVNDMPAIDPNTGFFRSTAQSIWSSVVDGFEIDIGGAAYQLPDSINRNVYTYLGNVNLTNPSNSVEDGNANITTAMLGIGLPGDPTRQQVLDFARGADLADANANGNTTESRREMGDPLHAQPVTLIYGGTTASPDVNDAVIFFATNDGYMHAIDTETGEELWSFIPPEFLDDLAPLYANEATSNKHYGVDGNPTLQLVTDSDGVLETGETAYLFFGMRRGGSYYYALDVSDKLNPTFLWRLDTSTLPNAGQTWSTPVPTRVTVGTGAGQNAERLVLVIGGGYDTDQDGATTVVDNVGNSIYMVDSETGALLWHTSSAGSNLDLADMQYSIPADVKVIDIDSDGYADRMYASDMGGQVWRFDVTNGNAANSLVAGGVIATLGGAAVTPATVQDSRRFYYSPDVALVNGYGQTFIHIGIGSGHRAGPNGTSTQDAFYALRDYLPFGSRAQTGAGDTYANLVPFDVGDLIPIDVAAASPAVPDGSPGWRMDLVASGGFSGEKVLAEARTFNNQIFFTSFEPGGGTSTSCAPQLGTNRLYALNILNGGPVINLDDPTSTDPLDPSDRFRELNGSISSEVVFLFPSPDDPSTCVGDECTPDPIACVDLFCFSPPFDPSPVRTFWSQENTF